MASIAITHQYPPLPPPPMLDSSGSESNGGDGINPPNVLIDLLNEYVVIIKKRKEKIKSIKTQSDTLEFNTMQVLRKVCLTRNLRANTLSCLLSKMTKIESIMGSMCIEKRQGVQMPWFFGLHIELKKSYQELHLAYKFHERGIQHSLFQT